MTSNIALFSVLFLAVIVAVAFWRKCNIGILDKLCTDAGYSASDFAIPSMVIFCIYYKVWKIKPALQTSASSTAVAQKMSKEQVITALGIVVMVIMVVGFSISVGLASLAVAAVQMALKTSDEKKALAKVPWGTLLLITGMGGLHDCFQLRKQRRRTKQAPRCLQAGLRPLQLI